MIPYQVMTFGDYNFYWGDSIMFTKIAGEWLAVRPRNANRDGEYQYSTARTLERLSRDGDELRFQEVNSGDFLYASAMEPFESDDWITYEPSLGYFMLDRTLVLVTSSVPRSRHKGLHSNRLQSLMAIDESAIPEELISRVVVRDGYSLPMDALANEIASRLNTPFPDSWYSPVRTAILSGQPVILDAQTCAIPDSSKGITHVLYQGALLGHVVEQGQRLDFVPRVEPTTSLEKAVNTYLRSKLVTVATREATSNG